MPVNYTNNEFMRMREQAIENARDMHSRAAIKQTETHQSSADNNRTSVQDTLQEDGTVTDRNTLRFEKRPDIKDAFNHNTTHQHTYRNNNTNQRPQHKPPVQDNDRMLLMTLLLILIADGADKMLIFALMYIMM